MATQTRRTTPRSARFFKATVTASMVTACCGLVLWSAVAAHAGTATNGLHVNGLHVNGLSSNGLYLNGLSSNGLYLNGLSSNGLSLNGLPTQGDMSTGAVVQTPTVPAVPQESLPWQSLSKRALGEAAVPFVRDNCTTPLVELPEVR